MQTPQAPPSPRSLRLYYGACFVLVAASLGVLGWRLLPVRAAATQGLRIDETALRQVLSRPMPSSSGGSLRAAELAADHVVLFLFTPADCAAALPELRALNRLDEERADLGVVAVMSFSNVEEAAQTRESFGLTMPILQDPDGAVLAALHPPRTPWKVVVRRQDGKVLFEDPPNIAAAARSAFLERLRRLGV